MPRTAGSAADVTRLWRKARLPGSDRDVAVGHARIAKATIWRAAMLGWACATPSHAGQSDFGVGLSLARSSNITRVETNPQSDWTQAVMAGLSYRESTIDVNARVLAQVERRRYSRHTFSDDTAEFLDGAAVWLVLPRRLTWNIEDTFRQTLLD